MKLLLYTHTFAPRVGGIETFSMHLAAGLGKIASPQDQSTEVTVVTQTAGPDQPVSSQQSFLVIRQPRPKRLWDLIGAADKIVLAGPAILPALFALLRRKPLVISHHAYQAICPNGLLFYLPTQSACPGHFAAARYMDCVRCNAGQDGLARAVKSVVLTFFRRALCKLASKNVAVSEHVVRRIALPREQVILHGVPVVSPGVDIAESLSPNKRVDIVFAYVGRLVAEKGVPTLINAVKLLKGRGRAFRVVIVGDGPERERLRKMVSDLSVQDDVSFLGTQTGIQLRETMNQVSALIVPSIWEEAAGLSALEQMMQGTLVIGSNLGGLAEEISDAGLLFEAGNSADLADQMEKVITDPECAKAFRSRARERAMKVYSLDRMLQEYRTLLRSI